jgi:hypothetical protein
MVYNVFLTYTPFFMIIISRKEAKQQGLKYYFTGIPCKWGHISKRMISGMCYECSLNYRKSYYNANSETVIKKIGIWRQANLDKTKIYDALYYKNNKDKKDKTGKIWRNQHTTHISIRSRNWRTSNPHKVAESSKLRNTRLEQQIPSWYEEDLIKQLYQKRDELNEQWGTDFQVDHIIPLNPKCGTVSGLHCWANLQLLDASINSSKGGRYETDW